MDTLGSNTCVDFYQISGFLDTHDTIDHLITIPPSNFRAPQANFRAPCALIRGK